MNKLDPRFVESVGNNFVVLCGGTLSENSLRNYFDNHYPKIILIDEQPAGSFLEGVPKGSFIEKNGDRIIHYMPKKNETILCEDCFYRFDGNEWKDLFHIQRQCNLINKTVKGIYSTLPTTNGTNADNKFAVGDELLQLKDLKYYKVKSIASSTNKITWDTGVPIASEGTDSFSIRACSVSGDGYCSHGVDYYKNDTEEVATDFYLSNGTVFYNEEDSTLYYYGYNNSNSEYKLLKVIDASDSATAKLTTFSGAFTAEEITAKSFTLPSSVTTGEENNVLCFVNGLAQPVGTAFTVSGTTFSWDGLTLDGTVSVGDTVIVQYYTTAAAAA